jgi:hypothetical protein
VSVTLEQDMERRVWIDTGQSETDVQIYAVLSPEDAGLHGWLKSQGFIWSCGALHCVFPNERAREIIEELLKRDFSIVTNHDRWREREFLGALGIERTELIFHEPQNPDEPGFWQTFYYFE